LNPQKGTVFEKAQPPSIEYQSEWIRKTRQSFPDIDIQAGIWLDRVDYVSELFLAGANSISKFPALKAFGSRQAKEVEHQAKLAGREFKGTLTKMPDISWDDEVEKQGFEKNLSEQIKKKIKEYLKGMQKHN
jgi:biotin synthase-like enzyme